VAGREDDAARGFGDGADASAGFQELLGRAGRVDAPPSRRLLPVRGVAELVGDGVVGFLEGYVPQQRLHPVRVVGVGLDHEPDLAQVVLRAVRGVAPGHGRREKPLRVLADPDRHSARV